MNSKLWLLFILITGSLFWIIDIIVKLNFSLVTKNLHENFSYIFVYLDIKIINNNKTI